MSESKNHGVPYKKILPQDQYLKFSIPVVYSAAFFAVFSNITGLKRSSQIGIRTLSLLVELSKASFQMLV